MKKYIILAFVILALGGILSYAASETVYDCMYDVRMYRLELPESHSNIQKAYISDEAGNLDLYTVSLHNNTDLPSNKSIVRISPRTITHSYTTNTVFGLWNIRRERKRKHTLLLATDNLVYSIDYNDLYNQAVPTHANDNEKSTIYTFKIDSE